MYVAHIKVVVCLKTKISTIFNLTPKEPKANYLRKLLSLAIYSIKNRLMKQKFVYVKRMSSQEITGVCAMHNKMQSVRWSIKCDKTKFRTLQLPLKQNIMTTRACYLTALQFYYRLQERQDLPPWDHGRVGEKQVRKLYLVSIESFIAITVSLWKIEKKVKYNFAHSMLLGRRCWCLIYLLVEWFQANLYRVEKQSFSQFWLYRRVRVTDVLFDLLVPISNLFINL